ncbi:hypothetical protein E3N88_01024 [Mikania micrantha]|uniref:Uncharacterized protein n=1 Tax=Mikania micrantha TaxID=192012 RepID=A0A5N6Q246_9ASTR|nr:hypothetical protein E3N88_01024 [Mikania micrantha]
MTISSVIKIKRGKKTTRKQQSIDPDPDKQSKVDERRNEPSTTEDAGPQPTATTDAAVGSNVEDVQARDKRSQATAQDRPRFRRRKSIARRKKRTSAIFSDSEPDSPPSGPKDTPAASKPKDHPKDLHGLMHHHSYIPIFNGGIQVLDMTQLLVLAEPFIFDLERLPLENPDNGSNGIVAVKWVKARAQLPKILFHTKDKDKEFRGLSTKTVADYFHSTKGTDTRHAGLSENKDNIPIVRHSTLLPFLSIKCKRSSEALKINNIKCLLYLASLWLSQCLYL